MTALRSNSSRRHQPRDLERFSTTRQCSTGSRIFMQRALKIFESLRERTIGAPKFLSTFLSTYASPFRRPYLDGAPSSPERKVFIQQRLREPHSSTYRRSLFPPSVRGADVGVQESPAQIAESFGPFETENPVSPALTRVFLRIGGNPRAAVFVARLETHRSRRAVVGRRRTEPLSANALP